MKEVELEVGTAEVSSSKVKKSTRKSADSTRGQIENQDERSKALSAVFEQIEKSYGKGSIMKLGDSMKNISVEKYPTGLIELDIALGCGGIPKGRIIEIYGPESSGKTTITLHMIAEIQKRGGNAAFIDAEHALDPSYAAAIGVDIDSLIVSQPDNGDQALSIVDALVRSNAVEIIVVDSVAALVPRQEIEGEMGDSHMGVHARLMSQALRKLTGFVSKSKCTVVFINQLRQKIGNSYGPSETTTGGNALKFYASVRLDIRKGEVIKKGEDSIGARTKIKVVKNKVAPPFKTIEVDIIYGKGVSNESSILDLAAEIGIVKKSGSWYSYNEGKLGQGRDNAREYLIANPDLLAEISSQVLKHYNITEE